MTDSTAWQTWAHDLLEDLGRHPLPGPLTEDGQREMIAQLAGMAPGVPRCSRCGCFSTRHEVDDEELRACADCECAQFTSGAADLAPPLSREQAARLERDIALARSERFSR